MAKYKSKTDWICNKCGTINGVYARTCRCCLEKKRGKEKMRKTGWIKQNV